MTDLGLLLMFRTQEVVDRFDGVECAQGHFDKGGEPVTHGTIPQSGAFEGLEFASVF